MGSIKIDKSGKQRHWMDGVYDGSGPRLPAKRPVKKSLCGQKPLFPDVPIDHLKHKSER